MLNKVIVWMATQMSILRNTETDFLIKDEAVSTVSGDALELW